MENTTLRASAARIQKNWKDTEKITMMKGEKKKKGQFSFCAQQKYILKFKAK